VKQVFDVSVRKWKGFAQHDCQTNDLRAAVKVLEGVMFVHVERCKTTPDHRQDGFA